MDRAFSGNRRARHDRFAPFRSLDGPVLAGGPTVRHDPDLDARPSLVVLLPHLTLARMSGGPNTIFQVTARLAREGVPLRYVAAFGALAPSIEAIREHVTTLTGVDVHGANVEWVDASAAGASIAVGRGDVFLATWWRSAHVARSGLDHVRAGEFLYLVQDFEPGFYPWSTKYALAATYALPARAIIIRRCARAPGRLRVRSVLGSAPGRGLPAVGRSRGVPRPRTTREPTATVAFYARPRNARNLFELGLRVLESRSMRASSPAVRGTSPRSARSCRSCHCRRRRCCGPNRGCPTRRMAAISPRATSCCR